MRVRGSWVSIVPLLAAAGFAPGLFAGLGSTVLAQERQPISATTPVEAAPQPAEPTTVSEDAGRKLKFNFRFQPWVDVLEWFAEQSDLSLVLDAPPPGTFNYTDSREYTVPEAIDLINGVLLTKGYTLLRRERMLMVLDLANGLPADLVPRVTIADLEKRGRFELVSVVFPLANRDAAEVEAEIKPLLGPHGKTAILPKTRQLLVSEMAGKMRSIAAVIESIPTPDVANPAAAVGNPAVPGLASYPLDELDGKAILEILKAMYPDAKVVVDAKAGRLIASAVPEQQAGIEKVIAQLKAGMTDGQSPRLQSYPVRQAYRSELFQILRPIVPDANFQIDSRTGNLLVFGTPDQQAAVAHTLEQLGRQAPEGGDRRIEIYALERSEPSTLLTVLQKMVPEAPLAVDAATKSIVAFGDDVEQATIKQAIERLESRSAEHNERRMEVYPLGSIDGTTLVTVLAKLTPLAQVTLDAQRKQLMAVALPLEHERIKGVLDQIAAAPGDSPPELRLYPVRVATSTPLLTLLAKSVPTAQVAIDTVAGNLVALASAEDHEKIRTAVEGIAASPQSGLVAQVYSAPETDAATLLQLLTAAAPDARLVANTKANTVMVWARPEQHAALGEAVKQISSAPAADAQRVAKVYRFRNADANAAYAVLRYLVPYAQFAVDTRTGSLAATALPSEHKLIEATVVEMDGQGGPLEGFELKVYPVGDQDPSTVLSIGRDLFAYRPEVRLSIDSKTGKLVAWAPPAQQETIRNMLAGMNEHQGKGDERQIDTYSLENTDPAAVFSVLSNLFANRAEVRIAPDRTGRSITVLAPPDVQGTVKATIDQMRGEGEEFDVIPLRVVDPFSAASSIRRLFGDAADGRSVGAPRVDADSDAQQIVVRGTKQQILRIRELLTKMGEPAITPELASGTGRKLRVIPIGDRATRAALEELQRVWPQLRANPIRVVTPSAVVPTMKENPSPDKEPKSESEKSSDNNPLPLQPGEGRGEGEAPKNPALEAKPTTSGAISSRRHEELLAFAFGEEQKPAKLEDPHPNPLPEGEGTEEAQQPAPPTAESESPSSTEVPGELAPIVVAPGRDSVTIASEDLEALNQFEELLKSISQRYALGGREFTVFTLKRANVMVVSDTLEKLFDGGSFGVRSSSVTIVPDQRLNALVVQANRNDLATIEGLIEVLDTGDATENLAARKPRVVPLVNASAVEVAEVIRDTYKTQLSASSSRRQVPSPRGVSRELAAVIDELNSAASGPEMTLSVDVATNSLIVLASQPLFDEVKTLVESLDASAGSGTRTVKVVPLTKTNSKAMQQALKTLFDTQGRRRSRD